MSLKRKIFLLLFLIILLVPFIGRETSYTLPAEYRWTLPTVVSTYNASSWKIPKLWNSYRFKKPPAAYWSMVGLSKILGLKLFSVRLSSVIFGILSVFLFLKLLEKFRFEYNEMMITVFLLATSTGFFTYSRIAALEIPMLFVTLGTFYGLSDFILKKRKKGLYIAAVFLGLSMLIKSHATFAGAVFFMLLWTVINRQWDLFTDHGWAWIKAGGIFLLVVLPWYLYLYTGYRESFLASMSEELVGERFQEGSGSFFGMLKGLLTLLLPYTLLFFNSLYLTFKNNSPKKKMVFLYTLSLILPYLFVVSYRMRYMVPVLPGAVLLIGLNLKEMNFKDVWVKLTYILFVLIPGLLIFYLGLTFKIYPFYIILITLLIVAGTGYFYFTGRLKKAVIFTGIFELLAFGYLYSHIGLWEIPDTITRKLKGKKVATFKRRPFFLPVKMGRSQDIDINSPESFKKAVDRGALIYVPENWLDKVERFMAENNYTEYKKKITWERFNEFPKNSQVKEALKEKDLGPLKTETYFIGDIK
ncbi:MAG: ArnT family glycosyltransferase [Elusimicrobiota bacterium]